MCDVDRGMLMGLNAMDFGLVAFHGAEKLHRVAV